MNSTNTTTTFFAVNSSGSTNKSRNTVCISVEEFEDLMEYKRICENLFAEFGGELL